MIELDLGENFESVIHLIFYFQRFQIIIKLVY